MLRRLRDARSRVDSLHAEMRDLARLTLTVPGRTMYLCLHRRGRTGQTALRWRQAGVQAPHLSWHEVASQIGRFPRTLAEWYRSVNVTARQLNHAEVQARASLKAARAELGSLQVELDGA